MVEYVIQGRYAHGWEDVTAESTREDANARLREYDENEPRYPHRIVKREEREEGS